MLAELDHAEVIAPGNALIAAAVEQSHEVHPVGRRFGIGGRVCERHFDLARGLALHEHIVQYALRVDSFGVKHRIAAAEGTESAGVELTELRLFERRLTQQLRFAVGLRHLHENQPA